MSAWATEDVRLVYDYISPSEATEIRLLPNLPRGEIVHARTPPGHVSQAATLDGITEFYFVLAGRGELWRADGDTEEITALRPGRCVVMPAGSMFQYRTSTESLEFLVITGPRWEKERWRPAERAGWAAHETAFAPLMDPLTDSAWTADLDPRVDYPAPDGSDIRLLLAAESAGVAHCTLAAGATSKAVRHGTVDEIWFIVGGRGELWRSGSDGDGETVDLRVGRCITIPVGTAFQFRALGGSPLRFLIGTFPKWPGEAEAEAVSGAWAASVVGGRS